MPPPKDPIKLEAYKKKLSDIAKSKGYGKWMKGKKASIETKKKMSKSQLARMTPDECKRRSDCAKELGYGKWMKGRPANVGFLKSGKARKGKTYEEIYGAERAEEEALKRKLGNIGKKKKFRSNETKEKLKTSSIRKGKTYEEIYGKERAEEEALKRHTAHLKRWKGKIRKGCRDKQNGDRFYVIWRKSVFERDQYTCQKCNTQGGRLHAHHIKHWAECIELRYVLSNGITLCPKCHSKEHPGNIGLLLA